MDDLEAVLRFFALRHAERYTRGMHGFLDLYMARARSFTEGDITFLQNLYLETINLAHHIYQDHIFRPYDPVKHVWRERAQIAFYDAVMVGLSCFLNKKQELVLNRAKIIEHT